MTQEGPHNAPASTQAQTQSRLDAVRRELRELHERMDTIRQEVADEVDRRWPAMWRTPEMFDVRLSGHEEHRCMLARAREAGLVEAALAGELDHAATTEPGQAP
ncbi:MAG: hypothetical protein ACRD0K_15625 [Egibacteraceae bacterium]